MQRWLHATHGIAYRLEGLRDERFSPPLDSFARAGAQLINANSAKSHNVDRLTDGAKWRRNGREEQSGLRGEKKF